MMPQKPQKTTKPRLGTMGVLTIILIAILAAGAYWLSSSIANQTRNYAKEVAEPIEKALQEAGGKKVCDTGDNGRGIDNRTPWYKIVFETSLTRVEAAKLTSDIARAKGYNLTYEQSSYDYIDWYIDKNSKPAPYASLNPGKIELGINIYSGGNNLNCANGYKVKYDANNAAIVVNVLLPSFKH